MKSGPNFKEVNKIKRMYAEGLSTEEISMTLGINPKNLETFKEKKKTTKKVKPKVAETAENGST